jgi:hypothetical protein
MLTGSFASSYHGMPRATQDIDFVVAPGPGQVESFVRLLPETEYYVDLQTALDALSRQSQFNVIDLATGWKIDLIIRKSRPFSIEEFDRREPVEVEGLRLFIASAEDVVLSKLEWARGGASARQIEDAAGILRVRSSGLDQEYLGRWVRTLDLAPQWQAAREIAGLT